MQGHCQVWSTRLNSSRTMSKTQEGQLSQTLIVELLKIHLFSLIQKLTLWDPCLPLRSRLVSSYLPPYMSELTAALSLQHRVGTSATLAVRSLRSKKRIQQVMRAYGVHAISQTIRSTKAILARVSSICWGKGQTLCEVKV